MIQQGLGPAERRSAGDVGPPAGFSRGEFAGVILPASFIDKLVSAALADLARGKSLSIPDPRYKALMGVVKVTPRALLGGISSKTGRKYEPR